MNAFWEDLRLQFGRLFHRGRAGVENLAESLDRQAALQRLTTSLRAAIRERNDLLLQIGKKVYTLHVRGKVRNRDVLADCRRIDELREVIQALQVQQDAIRLRGLGETAEPDLTDESQLVDEEDAAVESAAEAPEAELEAETTAETEPAAAGAPGEEEEAG